MAALQRTGAEKLGSSIIFFFFFLHTYKASSPPRWERGSPPPCGRPYDHTTIFPRSLASSRHHLLMPSGAKRRLLRLRLRFQWQQCRSPAGSLTSLAFPYQWPRRHWLRPIPNTMNTESISPAVKFSTFNVKMDFNTSTRLASQIAKSLVRTGVRYFVEIAQEDYDEEYAVNEILQAATLVKHARELDRNANRRLNPLSDL